MGAESHVTHSSCGHVAGTEMVLRDPGRYIGTGGGGVTGGVVHDWAIFRALED